MALVGAEQGFEPPLFLGELSVLLAQLHFLELAQRLQPHIEDGFGLIVGEREGGDQRRLGVVLLADDADDLIEIEVGNDVAFEHFEAIGDLLKPVLAAADQHDLAVIEPRLERIGKTHDARQRALVEHVQIKREAH